MNPIVSISHFQQSAEGYCLSACVRMVLTHLGLERSEAEVSQMLLSPCHCELLHSTVVLLIRAETPSVIARRCFSAEAIPRLHRRGLLRQKAPRNDTAALFLSRHGLLCRSNPQLPIRISFRNDYSQ